MPSAFTNRDLAQEDGMQRIWGFDIGTTSVGFAVVHLDEEHDAGTIAHEGVRIFPEGRTEDKLEPRNQARHARCVPT